MDDAQGYQEGYGHDLVLLKQEWIKYALVPFHHLFVVISLVCQEELTSYLLLVFGNTEHKTMLKSKLILEDEFDWTLPLVVSGSDEHERSKPRLLILIADCLNFHFYL
jgi:hypothetical protein